MRAPAGGRGLGRDRAAHRDDELVHDRQAEAGAGLLAHRFVA